MAKKKHAQKKTNSVKSAPKKTSGPAKKTAVKNRGGLLSTLIVLIFLHGAFATYLAYTELKAEYARSTSWVLPVLALVSVAVIVSAVGMWYWKKWAITLYAITCVIQATVHLVLTGSMMVMFYDILPVSILAYVINLQNKQKLFE